MCQHRQGICNIRLHIFSNLEAVMVHIWIHLVREGGVYSVKGPSGILRISKVVIGADKVCNWHSINGLERYSFNRFGVVRVKELELSSPDDLSVVDQFFQR